MQTALDTGIIERHAAMQGAAIVPQDNIAHSPFVGVGESVLRAVLDEKLDQLAPFIETRPMSTIVDVFDEVHSKKTDKRIVLEPDF